MEDQTQVSGSAVEGAYVPAVVTELGTVTGATLGSNNQNNADDTEYWS
ncbi:hypothetical protein [Streptomyces sp. ME19-01-6]|nr:hypothetical protein [Streptomyces sp. ME19-01-6]MDX3232550.1 hypothetical protein [Streptomyces sp. ME19-01-6]